MNITSEKHGNLVLKGLKAGTTGILLFFMIFLCLHFKEYQKNANDQVNKYRIDQACLLAEGIEASQPFTAKYTHLKTMKLYFSNDYGTKAKGELHVKIVRIADGKEIKHITKKINKLLNNEYTEFKTNIQLKKGEDYRICLYTQGAESGKEPIVYQWRTKERGIHEKLCIQGEEQAKYLVCKFYYPVTIYLDWMAICLLLGLSIFIIWIPNPLPEKYQTRLGLFLFYAAPVFTFWFVERFTSNSITRIHPGLVALNFLVYGIFYGILYLILISRRVTLCLGMATWCFIGIANYYVLSFKGAPIIPSDLMSASTAAGVAANYTYTVQPVFVWNILLVILYITLFSKMHIEKKSSWKARLILLIGITLVSTVLGAFIIQQKALKSVGVKNNVWDQKKGYAKNGLFFGFVLNMNSLVQGKPSGYSKDAAREITEKYKELYADNTIKKSGILRPANGKKPNMIFIMNEAFSDLSFIHELETNQDYMPYIRSMTEDTIKGNLYMSIFGSGTCNSEFEFLTGDSMSSLQNGIIAYTQVLKGEIPNVTQILKAQGYKGNLALHPFLASGWNRPQVYEWMGFEQFYSEDAFEQPLMYRKYISDQSNMEMIEHLYEQREDQDNPFYLFNVTMQNHGGFDKVYDNFNNDVHITDLHQSEQAEQYLSLVKKTDEAFQKLVEYFKKVEEPTIIVMFGDHQPAVEASFYESLLESGDQGVSSEEFMKKYVTPFIIWANYDIKEKNIDKMSANYLSAYVMREAGLKITDYQKFLLDLYEKLPVITAVGCYDDKGEYYKNVKNTPYKEEVEEYQILQYNNLIDLKNTVRKFFYLEKGKRNDKEKKK